MAVCSNSPIRSREQNNSVSSQEQYNNNNPTVQSSRQNTPTAQHQSDTTDVNDVKINVSSHYDSPSLSRRSTSSNNESKELDVNCKVETSPRELTEVVNIRIEKPVTIPIQDTNNDDHAIDVTKPVNDMVTIKNECNNSTRRQSSGKKKDTHICNVL